MIRPEGTQKLGTSLKGLSFYFFLREEVEA